MVAEKGYIGTVTGACLSDVGHSVACADARRVERVSQGHVHVHEPRLAALVRSGFDSVADDGSADTSGVFRVARDIGGLLDEYTVATSKKLPFSESDSVDHPVSL